jgi:hypothetical protein
MKNKVFSDVSGDIWKQFGNNKGMGEGGTASPPIAGISQNFSQK